MHQGGIEEETVRKEERKSGEGGKECVKEIGLVGWIQSAWHAFELLWYIKFRKLPCKCARKSLCVSRYHVSQ